MAWKKLREGVCATFTPLAGMQMWENRAENVVKVTGKMRACKLRLNPEVKIKVKRKMRVCFHQLEEKWASRLRVQHLACRSLRWRMKEEKCVRFVCFALMYCKGKAWRWGYRPPSLFSYIYWRGRVRGKRACVPRSYNLPAGHSPWPSIRGNPTLPFTSRIVSESAWCNTWRRFFRIVYVT